MNRDVLVILEIFHWIGLSMVILGILHGNDTVVADFTMFIVWICVGYLMRRKYLDYKKEYKENEVFNPNGKRLIMVVLIGLITGLVCLYYTFSFNR